MRSLDPNQSLARSLRFGEFRFNPSTGELSRAGASVPLAPKPALILARLLAQPGELVTRDELYAAGWSDTVVDYELALNTAIRHIRTALRDDAANPRFIQTVPRRGYRFVARVAADRRRSAARMRIAVARSWPRSGRWLAGSAAVLGAFLALGLWSTAAAIPTIEIASLVPLDTTLDAGMAELLEGRIRHEAARHAGSRMVVRAAARDRVEGSRAHYVVEGILYSAAGQPRLDVQLVRTSDQAIIWSGWFNPRCPYRADPGAFIADHIARVLARRAT